MGGSYVGVPSIPMGKTKYLTIGITAHLADVTDLYRERVDFEKEQYFVDGEWRPLTVYNEEIKVKGAPSLKRKVYVTHRGPLITAEDKDSSEVLFGGSLPQFKEGEYFSFAWGGAQDKDNMMELFREIAYIKSA